MGTDDTATSERPPEDLSTALVSHDDAEAIGAAYELGSTTAGLDALGDHFYGDDINLRSIAAYGMVRAGERALSSLLSRLDTADADLAVRIIDVIGDIGPKAVAAVPQITKLSNSPEPAVRRAAIEALGMLVQRQTSLDVAAGDALSQALGDDDAIVVRNATFAVARLGAKACTEHIVDQVARNLDHWHHHVRGWIIETL